MTDSHGRKVVRSLAAVVVATALIFGIGVTSAAAQDDAAVDQRVVRLVGTYDIQPDLGQVEVVEEITVSNVRGSRRSGNTITSYFWTGHTVWVPADAENVSIQVEGVDLEWEVFETVQEIDIISADYRSNLNFGQTKVIDVSYTLPTYAPGSGQRRINGAFFFFDMITCCDFEEVDLTVSAPDHFLVIPPTNPRFESTFFGGQQRYNYSDDEVTGQFTELIFSDWSGFHDAGMASANPAVGQTPVELIYPPDDGSWGEVAESDISEIGAALEELIGTPFPIEDLVVRQDQIGDFEQWGGTGPFDEPLDIPREYDRPSLASAMAKTWLAAGPFEDETLNEGLALEFASAAVARSGESPTTLSAPGGSGALNSEGKHWLIREISNEIGLDGLTQILQMAAADETAYIGEGAAEQTATIPTDWRRFIDLAEQRLGSEQAASLFEEYVLDDAAIAELDERSVALNMYQELAAKTDGVVPLGIRNAMTNWDFDEAQILLSSAQEVVAERDRVVGDDADRQSDAGLALGQEWANAQSAEDFEEIRSAILERDSALARAGLVRWALTALGVVLLIGLIVGGLLLRRRKGSGASTVVTVTTPDAQGFVPPQTPPQGFAPPQGFVPPPASPETFAPPVPNGPGPEPEPEWTPPPQLVAPPLPQSTPESPSELPSVPAPTVEATQELSAPTEPPPDWPAPSSPSLLPPS